MPPVSEYSRAVFPAGSLGEYNPIKRYLSLAHSEADIARFLEVARATLRVDCRGG